MGADRLSWEDIAEHLEGANAAILASLETNEILHHCTRRKKKAELYIELVTLFGLELFQNKAIAKMCEWIALCDEHSGHTELIIDRYYFRTSDEQFFIQRLLSGHAIFVMTTNCDDPPDSHWKKVDALIPTMESIAQEG